MITLQKIQLNNFLSHEDTEVSFSENEKFLIAGQSGAGKSTIFDAIIWALYGKGRSDNRSLIRRGEDKAEVTLYLNNDDEVVKISRSISLAGKHLLDIQTQQKGGPFIAAPITGLRELQNFIETDLIGASYTLFINSVAYVQGGVDSFVGQSASKRKDLLLEIFKTEDFDQYYEKAKDKLTLVSNDKNKLEGQKAEIEENITKAETIISGKASVEAIVTDHEALVSALRTNIREQEEALRPFTDSDVVVKTRQEEVRAVSSQLGFKRNELARNRSNNAVNEVNWARIATEGDIKGKRQDYEAARATVKTRIDQLSGVRAKVNIDALVRDLVYSDSECVRINETAVCPSGDSCPYSKDRSSKLAKEMERNKNLREQIDEAKKNNEENDAEIARILNGESSDALVSQVTTYTRRIADIDYELAQIAQLISTVKQPEVYETDRVAIKTDIQNLTQELDAAQKILDEAISASDQTKKAALLASIDESHKILQNAENKLLNAKATLMTIEASEATLSTLKLRLKDLTENQLPLLNDKEIKLLAIKDAFGSKGIKTVVIDYMLPKLQDDINAILGQLSEFRIRLDTQRATVDGEGVSEGLFITIINETGEELPFESYSGGEKLKISMSIAEALASLQKVGFRLLDEAIIGLDENSIDGFVAVLDKLQSKFKQIGCISHLLQIQDLFDKKLIVAKVNGKSYVRQ